MADLRASKQIHNFGKRLPKRRSKRALSSSWLAKPYLIPTMRNRCRRKGTRCRWLPRIGRPQPLPSLRCSSQWRGLKALKR